MPVTDPSPDVWNETLLQNPHEVSDKRSRVQKMFAAIAPSYDLNNRLHSLWMDQAWRRRAVKLAQLKPTDVVVDVACGTGDLAIRFAHELFLAEAEEWCSSLKNGLRSVNHRRAARVIGLDFTFDMLPFARMKAPRALPWLNRKTDEGLWEWIERFLAWINGDALALPLRDSTAN